MKNFFRALIPLVVLGAVVYHFRNQIFVPAPCTEPIAYTLGTFSTQFNISKEYFLSALVDAEAVWEKPFGKELFAYAPEDGDTDVLKINLIYDYRQQATSKLASLGITVENNRASYEALKAKFTALKAEYESEKRDYEAGVKAFNQSGRTDADEFKSLENKRQNLNDKVDEINALVVALNRLVATLNLSVEKYNTTSGARGESFEEGVYSSDGWSSEIDIYEFSSRRKLVRVLAHELGHALGLDHVADSKAIMYELNKDNSETLTKADLAALKEKCGVE